MNLLESLIESYPDTEFLIADGFDDAVIGYHQQSERLIYSIKKCIDILIDEGVEIEGVKFWGSPYIPIIGQRTRAISAYKIISTCTYKIINCLVRGNL